MGEIFLKAVKIPDYCYLSEVVEWVALGRIPEVIHSWNGIHTSSDSDLRFDPANMPNNFDLSRRFLNCFTKDECLLHNIEYDEKYGECAYYVWKHSEATQFHPRFSVPELSGKAINIDYEGNHDKFMEEHGAALKEFSVKSDYVAGQTIYSAILEEAWAKVYQHIRSHQILVEGMSWKDWDKIEATKADLSGIELSKFVPFKPIPSTAISLSIPWETNSTENEDEFFNLRVSTDYLKEISPSANSDIVSVTRIGDTFCYDKDNSSPGVPTPKRRGRPPMFDWPWLQIWFVSEHVKRKTPPNKDSAAAYVASMAEKKFGKNPSRTTVLDQMKDVFTLAYGKTDGN